MIESIKISVDLNKFVDNCGITESITLGDL
jgi:hypothetical protein